MMIADIDLSQLSEISTGEKTFLSLYLSNPRSLDNLEKKFKQILQVLKSNEAAQDEREYFEENVKAVINYLKNNPFKSGSLCIFSCWVLDFFQTYKLTIPVKDLVWIDSSPYIRPLAELKEEYENVAVVIADNKKARIFLISATIPDHESSIEGNIKNHVKKGGWSQQRYERRRDKQLLNYSQEIIEALMKLDKDEQFRRIILVGSKEILTILHENLPKSLQNKAAQKAIDLHKSEETINDDIRELFISQERQSEENLWEKIRSEYLRNGLGIVGIENVLKAVKIGQVEEIIVNRDYQTTGKRCRNCENLETGNVKICSQCGSDSLFRVDLVNEIVEFANQTGASIDFCDSIASLKEAGEIAAFLRFRY